MDKTALAFFKQLVAEPTPSGSEQPGQARVAEYMRRFTPHVESDVHGNIHGVVNPAGKRRVMLAGHCDEIGLMVQHIDDKGYLYLSAIGGVNVPLLQGERITLHTQKGPLHGVVGVKPIHVMDPKERETAATKLHELWVDIGADSRSDAERAVRLGDVATIQAGWLDLRNGRVACRGFDNRMGAFIVSDVLRLLHGTRPKVAVHAVSTVQEEIGLRGARTAAFTVDPQVGIAVDVGFATDFPGMNEKMMGTATLGAGPILHRGPTYNPHLFDLLERTAKRARVRTQMQPDARGTGTDAYAMQTNRGGVAVALISVPSRYMHSPVETIALRDVEATVRLIAETILAMTGRESFHLL